MKWIQKLLCLVLIAIAMSAAAASQVDINSADARTLAQSLNGIGLVKAEAIVAYRNAHGPFRSLDDLAKVQGIGPRTLEENRTSIVFGMPRPAASGAGNMRPFASSWR